MKYVFVVIIVAIIITLIALFMALGKLMKKLAITGSKVSKLNENIEEVNNKKEEISKTKENWKFFTRIYIVLTILKEVMDDYKDAKKKKRNFAKSFSKTCVRSVSKINKLI